MNIQNYKFGDAKVRLIANDELAIAIKYYNDGDVTKFISLSDYTLHDIQIKKKAVELKTLPIEFKHNKKAFTHKLSISSVDSAGLLKGKFKGNLFGIFPLYWVPIKVKPETLMSLLNEIEKYFSKG